MFWPFTVWGFLKPNCKPHEYWLSKTRCCNSTYRLRYWNLFVRLGFLTDLSLCCNSTYRLRYWNYGFPNIHRQLWVATVLTACGIETWYEPCSKCTTSTVATVLTACGIETYHPVLIQQSHQIVATVLTACGIETQSHSYLLLLHKHVATVLTACGIETLNI
mgnify:CR=1 FL=1